MLRRMAFKIPYSPYRGIVWTLFNKNSKSLLEIGCKRGDLMKSGNFSKHNSFKVGLDVHSPYLREIKDQKIYDDLVVADGKELPFKDNSFDSVIAIEIIEHMTREEGYKLMKEMERVAKIEVIISTTDINGNKALENLSEDQIRKIKNKAMIHRSLWTPRDFKRRGYSVWGVYPKFFPKIFDFSEFDPVYLLSIFFPLILFVFFFPNFAKAIIAKKRIQKNSK